jgi:hypothetical protein
VLTFKSISFSLIHCAGSDFSVSKGGFTPPQDTTPLNLPPSDPLATPLGQVLALRDQTLVNRTGQHRDAVLTDLVAEVLTGDADGARAGGFQDAHIQVVPFLSGGSRASSGHRRRASTPALVAVIGRGQVVCVPGT